APVEHHPDVVRVDARLANDDVGPAVPVDVAHGVRADTARRVGDDGTAGVDDGQGVGLVRGDVADAVAVEVGDVDVPRVPEGHRVGLGAGKCAVAVAVVDIDVCVVPAPHGHVRDVVAVHVSDSDCGAALGLRPVGHRGPEGAVAVVQEHARDREVV